MLLPVSFLMVFSGPQVPIFCFLTVNLACGRKHQLGLEIVAQVK